MAYSRIRFEIQNSATMTLVQIKNEMFYNRDWHAVSLTKFEQILDEYLNWYAQKRIKVSLGGLSPVEFRKRNGIHLDCPA